MEPPMNDAEPPKQERISDTQRVLDLVLEDPDTELFVTPEGEAFVAESREGRVEYNRVSTAGYRRRLSGRFYYAYGKAISDSAIKTATETLTGIAECEGNRHEVKLRVAKGERGDYYIDAADDLWRAVRVSADGVELVERPPVRFRRSQAMLPLALPAPPPDDSRGHLRDFLNIKSAAHELLVRAWLLQTLREAPQYPILILKGRPGSAKSTTARMLASLVDPTGGDLQGEPTDIRDLMIAGKHSHILAFDNLTEINRKVSDALCCVATGAGYQTRALYTDDDLNIIKLTRPMILAGIGNAADRPDLLDRAIVVELEPIGKKERRDDTELWAAFEAERPYILWRLLEDFRRGLARTHEEPPHLERMADFHRWGFRCLGTRFHDEYGRNRREEATVDALDASPVADVLIEWAASRPEGISMTAAELFDALNSELEDDKGRVKQPVGWPTSPRALTTHLKELAGALGSAGHTINFPRTAQKRLIEFQAHRPSFDEQLGF